jgi:ATP-dependent RNA helicase HelY
VPKHFNHRSPQERRDLGRRRPARRHRARRVSPSGGPAKSRGNGEDEELLALAHELRKHPCHGCPDREEQRPLG